MWRLGGVKQACSEVDLSRKLSLLVSLCVKILSKSKWWLLLLLLLLILLYFGNSAVS